jgi:hypothetical protein
VLASSFNAREDALLQLARTRRPRRASEWTEAKAVTFIVTLAAARSVTLAAARAGMSRKSAYALRIRDPAFAAAWNAATSVAIDLRRRRAMSSVQGNEVDEVDNPPTKGRQRYKDMRTLDGSFDAQMRDLFFATIANQAGTMPQSLARAPALP